MAQSVPTGNGSRRRFLRLAIGAATLAGAGGLLAACTSTPPAAPTAAPAAKPTTAPTTVSAGTNGIKVGVLNSLSGTMAISEVAVKNASLMAIDEINKKGGVLGSQLVPTVQDGASDWPTFADKTKLLLQNEKVSAVFGCWTSASRKAVLPVVEQLNGLL